MSREKALELLQSIALAAVELQGELGMGSLDDELTEFIESIREVDETLYNWLEAEA